jgi:hypothetical protein
VVSKLGINVVSVTRQLFGLKLGDLSDDLRIPQTTFINITLDLVLLMVNHPAAKDGGVCHSSSKQPLTVS